MCDPLVLTDDIMNGPHSPLWPWYGPRVCPSAGNALAHVAGGGGLTLRFFQASDVTSSKGTWLTGPAMLCLSIPHCAHLLLAVRTDDPLRPLLVPLLCPPTREKGLCLPVHAA